jgi:chaperonin GroES
MVTTGFHMAFARRACACTFLNLFPRRKLVKIIPRNDKVIVRRLSKKEVAQLEIPEASPIMLPDNMKESDRKLLVGEVVMVGLVPACENLAPGSLVLFGKYTGWDTSLAGTEYVVLKEEDVLAVLEK